MNIRASNIIFYFMIFFLTGIFMTRPGISLGQDDSETPKKNEQNQEADSSPESDAKSEKDKKSEDSFDKEKKEAANEAIQYYLEKKYTPPLSVHDAIRLTEDISPLIDPSVDSFTAPRKEKAQELLSLVTEYIKLADDRYSSLLFYRWYYVARERVSDKAMEEDVFRPRPVIKNVSALSFEAEGEDVLVHFMKVKDMKGKVTTFKIDKWIIEGLPRKEICYLYFPTTIKEIVMDYSTRPDSRAHLRLYAGVSDRPEHGKASIYYLKQAEKNIEQNNFEKARENLVSARNRLIKFNRQIRKR